jgi:hypothetical protein
VESGGKSNFIMQNSLALPNFGVIFPIHTLEATLEDYNF